MIGPKCQNCGKQRHHHGGKEAACPIGKKLAGAFFFFHTTDCFKAKDPKPRKTPCRKVNPNGSEKRKDRALRRNVKSQPCVACGTWGTDWNPVDPAHIRTWKVTQSDHPANLVSLCRTCHRLQHAEGWRYLICCYPSVGKALLALGWEITEHPFDGKLILTHKEIA